ASRTPTYINLFEPAPSVLVLQLVNRKDLAPFCITDGKQFGNGIVVLPEFGLIQQTDGIGVGEDTVLDDGIAQYVAKFLRDHDNLSPKFPHGFVQIEDVSSH